VEPEIDNAVAGLRGRGMPLPEVERAYFSTRFGYDFSGVRLHAGNEADNMARSLRAKAFTVGDHIVFGAGQYRPATREGRRLLAHELTHVVQQSGAEGQRKVLRNIGDGHDLASPRFSGDPVLEAVYDDERLVRRGDRGSAVAKIQQALFDLGHPLPRSMKSGVPDGIFGPETQGAVRKYQASAGLVSDGIVGPITMASLDSKFSGALPPCPVIPATTTISPGIFAAPLIPGLTCQLVTPALSFLSRILSVSLRTNRPTIERNPGRPGSGVVNMSINPEMRANASVTVAGGPDTEKFEFGFLQLCRPFEIIRATYRKDGTSAGSKNDLDFNPSMEVRKGLPALDHSTFWFAHLGTELKGSPPVTTAGRTATVNVTFVDPPAQFFQTEQNFNHERYTITGLAWQSFFFTAFSVKLPDGRLQHLKTFYWDIKHCERLKPGDAARPARGGPVNVAPARDCRSGSCDTGEPGFDKVDKARTGDTCLAALQSGLSATFLKGPDNFDIGCR
jgi:hypothetical protein